MWSGHIKSTWPILSCGIFQSNTGFTIEFLSNNVCFSQMRTSLVPNRASLSSAARLFTTTRATNSRTRIRNKTRELPTEMVRFKGLRDLRREKKVSVGVRLVPSEKPCLAESILSETRQRQLARVSSLGPRLGEPFRFEYILSDCYKMTRLLGPEWCLGQKLLAAVLYQLEQVGK